MGLSKKQKIALGTTAALAGLAGAAYGTQQLYNRQQKLQQANDANMAAYDEMFTPLGKGRSELGALRAEQALRRSQHQDLLVRNQALLTKIQNTPKRSLSNIEGWGLTKRQQIALGTTAALMGLAGAAAAGSYRQNQALADLNRQSLEDLHRHSVNMGSYQRWNASKQGWGFYRGGKLTKKQKIAIGTTAALMGLAGAAGAAAYHQPSHLDRAMNALQANDPSLVQDVAPKYSRGEALQQLNSLNTARSRLLSNTPMRTYDEITALPPTFTTTTNVSLRSRPRMNRTSVFS